MHTTSQSTSNWQSRVHDERLSTLFSIDPRFVPCATAAFASACLPGRRPLRPHTLGPCISANELTRELLLASGPCLLVTITASTLVPIRLDADDADDRGEAHAHQGAVSRFSSSAIHIIRTLATLLPPISFSPHCISARRPGFGTPSASHSSPVAVIFCHGTEDQNSSRACSRAQRRRCLRHSLESHSQRALACLPNIQCCP